MFVSRHLLAATTVFATTVFFSLAVTASCRGRPVPEPVARAQPPSPPSTAEARAVAWTQGPVASAAVTPGELAGLVVDAETGKLVSEAQVWLPGTMTAARSDSSGHFQLRMPNVAQSIRVLRIGYEPYSTVVTPHADSGAAVVFALRPATVMLCNVTIGDGGMAIIVGPNGRRTLIPRPPRVERHPGVAVTVRDALTGRAPPGVIAVSVRDSTFTDSVVAQSDSGNRAVAIAALDRPGRYDVTVRSDGYRDWTGSASTRIASECGGELIPAVFHVWLIPR
jgi:hypothetical protein